MKRNLTSWWTGLAFTLVVVLVAGSLAWGQTAPIIQGGQVNKGANIRQPVTQPNGFTEGTATSADPGVATVEAPNQARGSEGINITITGSGLSLITVTWKNPKTGETRPQYFLVNATPQRYTVTIARVRTVTVGSKTDLYYANACSCPALQDTTGHVTFGKAPNAYTVSVIAVKPGVAYINNNTGEVWVVVVTK
jgi:hypothetical protein